MTALRKLGLCLALFALVGCAETVGKNDDDDAGEDEGVRRDAPEGPTCLAFEPQAQLEVGAVENVDIVFAVDNTETMAGEQASLAEQFPRLINALASGDTNGDGVADFPSAASLQLAVVSTDLGVVGVPDFHIGCQGLGDNGRFSNTSTGDVPGCSATYDPPFLSFSTQSDDAVQVATDLQCIAAVGLDGCALEQPLESLLKAVWPASDMNVTFVTDLDGSGRFGQAGPGAPNGDFIRDDSVVALVVVTDEDDCSVRRLDFLAPDASPNGLGTRCFFEAQRGMDSSLFQVNRYIELFKMLRAGSEDQVIFAGIVGVPPHLIADDVVADYDLEDPDQASAFYDMLLAAPELQERVNDKGTPAALEDDGIAPSCDRGENAKAYPPRRIIEVAKGFRSNGIIQTVCQDDFSPAIDAIVERIGRKLGASCFPRPIPRQGGMIDCQLTWEFAGSVPQPCDQPFLTETEPQTPGTARCIVQQLAVEDGAADGEGWYYDDFSDVTERSCTGAEKQRIAFTDGAEPPPGAVVRISCFQANYYEGDVTEGADVLFCSAGPGADSSEVVGDPCLTYSVPEDGFDESLVYVEGNQSYCGEGVCMVFHLDGDPRGDCGERQDAVRCADAREVEQRVYCSCRCDAPAGFTECECPDGFSCVETLDAAPPEIAGGYCVRNGTVATD